MDRKEKIRSIFGHDKFITKDIGKKVGHMANIKSSKDVALFAECAEHDIKEFFKENNGRIPACVTIEEVNNLRGNTLRQRAYHTSGLTSLLSTYVELVMKFVYKLNSNVDYWKGYSMTMQYTIGGIEYIHEENKGKVIPNLSLHVTFSSDNCGFLTEYHYKLNSLVISKIQ